MATGQGNCHLEGANRFFQLYKPWGEQCEKVLTQHKTVLKQHKQNSYRAQNSSYTTQNNSYTYIQMTPEKRAGICSNRLCVGCTRLEYAWQGWVGDNDKKHVQGRVSKSCNHAITWLRKIFKNLRKFSANERETGKTITIWQGLSSFTCFMSFLLHVFAQNFQSDHIDCAKEFAFRKSGPGYWSYEGYKLLYIYIFFINQPC